MAFAEVLRRRPESSAVCIKLGNALNRSGYPRQALAAYEQAIRRAPESLTARRNKAITLLMLGRTQEAGCVFRRVVDLAPRDCRAHFDLARLCYHQGRLRQAVVHFETAASLCPEFGRAWYRLGNALKLMGEAGRALDAYRRAVVLLPGEASIFYSLGVTLNALGRRDEAKASLARAVVLDPRHPSARHLLNALSGQTPLCAPAGYVRQLFDRYAPRFDRQMRGPLVYQVPARLARELGTRRGGRRIFRKGLDLGCGTGLSGASLRPWTRQLTGVDLSPKILAEARKKNIYDRLVRQDVVDFLTHCAETFDLLVAADVLIYFGDLRPIFEAVRRRIAPDGRFFFSTESTRHHPYRLRRTGRFAHHRAHVAELAAACGFVVDRQRRMVIRKEHDRCVHGALTVLALGGKNK